MFVCFAAAHDPDVKGLLKVICRSPNADKVEDLSGVVTSYNNTPTILKRTTTVYKEKDYMEIDIDVYQFSTLVQRTIHGMLSWYIFIDQLHIVYDFFLLILCFYK